MQQLWDWLITSGVAVAALTLIGWMSRKYLEEWITGAVKHSFEADLEKLRADLSAEQRKVEALSGGALSGMAALQSANAERRVQASDALWKAVEEWNTLAWTVTQMSIVKFDECSKQIEKEPKLQQFFQTIGGNVSPDSIALGKGAGAARPYLSDLAWALYSTYRTVFIGAVLKLHMLKNGIDGREFMNAQAASEMLIKALPEHADRIAKYGDMTHPEMLNVLREKILAEIRRTIDGKEQDADSVKRAGEIIKLADDVHRSADMQKAKAPPGAKG